MNKHQQKVLNNLIALNIRIYNLKKYVEDSKYDYIDFKQVKKELEIIRYFLANIDKISYNSYNFVDEIEQGMVISNDQNQW